MADQLKKTLKRWSRQRHPQINGRIYLDSLQDGVTIRRDRWGIPHIYAQNRHDLFLAQGFVHAQDRLWQMELNRRAAKGELSAIFGRITLEADRLSRTFGFARLARLTLANLDEQAHDDLAAYSVGVNAFIARQSFLPIEFTIVKSRPKAWEMLDSIAYARLEMWALTHGAIGELVKAQLLQQVDPAIVNDLLMHYPENHPVTLPDGIEENQQWIDAWRGTAVPWTNPFLGKGSFDGAGRGSNGWVIGPARSESGGAILCNDMHLPVGTPSIWHYQHLHCADGLHVSGFTQPGLPYVMAGHNGQIAWGATLAYTDCEDLFLEKLHPNQPDLYRFKNDWQQAEQIDEVIEVRFQNPHREVVTLTHHGPLIQGLLEGVTQPLAFCSTALQADLKIDGFGWLNAASNWDEFVTAVDRIQSPSLNLLYADTSGNIGHWVAGQVPIRAAGDGTLPAPGWAGSHEWTGYVPFAKMPHALNPKDGLIISANNRLLAAGNSNHNLGQLWRNGYRAKRLQQLLETQEKINLAACREIQLDMLSLPGLQLTAQLEDLEPSDSQAALALSLLQNWDGCLYPESVGGSVFQVLVEQLTQALLANKIPDELRASLLGQGISETFHMVNEFQGYWIVNLIRILADVPSAWFPNFVMRNKLLERSLKQTTAVLQDKLGNRADRWQWGRLHQITFQHPLGQLAPFDRIFNIGPLPLGGDANTVAQAGMRPGTLSSDGISVSSRFIIDMNAVESGQAVLAPGQSGHLGSPHYDDLVELWRVGGYFPVLWEETAVVEATVDTLTLSKGP